MRAYLFILLLLYTSMAKAQTVTGMNGLLNTGETPTFGLVSGGTQVQSSATGPTLNSGWYVSYASSNGGSSINSTFLGDAYAITAASVSASGYTPSTTSAEWIVAPGASTSSTHTTGSTYVNKGGNYLPGNGTGSNEGLFAYTLAFNISGTGALGTVATSQLSIQMGIAADDGYSIYLNPLGYNVDPTTKPSTWNTPSIVDTQGQWNSTSSVTLANFGLSDNAIFYIGMNYFTVVVDNTNGITGSSSATTWNESGFMTYNMAAFDNGHEIEFNGRVVPEPATYGLIMTGLTMIAVAYRQRRTLLLR